MNNFKDLCKINDIHKYKERKIYRIGKCKFLNCNKKSKFNIKNQVVSVFCTIHKNNKSYNPECELRRLNNLFTDLADRPIVFIRFNPDSYINKKNKIIKSCFEYTEDKGLPKANKTLQTRLKKLKEVIDENLTKIPSENIMTIKLYYDET
jgi:hypothetical protein